MKAIISIIAVVIWSVAMYSSGYQSAYQEQTGQGSVTAGSTRFTSQDVWNAVNEYRVGKGIDPLHVYAPLCDNLVSRYHAVSESHDHSGFEAFVTEQVERGILPAGTRVTEVFASGDTPQETVDAWVGSMGHEIAITTRARGCAYSLNGLSIILMTD